MAARISGDIQRSEEAEALAKAIVASPVAFPYRIAIARLGLVLLAIQKGDLEAVRELYQGLKSTPSIMQLLISIDRVRGLLSTAMGESDQAIAHFEDGLTFTRRAGYRPEMAWICCDYADVLLKRAGPGDSPKAESLLEESLTIAQDMGRRHLIQRIETCREQLESQPG